MNNLATVLFSLIVAFAGATLVATAQDAEANSAAAASPNKPVLVFKTGFEGDTRIVSDGDSNHQIVGQDPNPPHKSDIVAALGIKKFHIEYTHGDASKRYAKIIPEPGNPNNKVLQFWIGEPWKASEGMFKARVQTDIYGLKTGYTEFYQSLRVYLHPDFKELRTYPHPIHWLTLAEFWNDTYWGTSKYKSRITFGIGKPSAEESDLNFILGSESTYQHWLWQPNNVKIKVPIGQWFTLEYFYQQGYEKTGRFYAAITPDGGVRQVVYDVQGWTQNPNDPAPDGITDWNPMKLYTSREIVDFMKARNKALQIYWDDFELWKNRQPTDSKPTPPPPLTERKR